MIAPPRTRFFLSTLKSGGRGGAASHRHTKFVFRILRKLPFLGGAIIRASTDWELPSVQFFGQGGALCVAAEKKLLLCLEGECPPRSWRKNLLFCWERQGPPRPWRRKPCLDQRDAGGVNHSLRLASLFRWFRIYHNGKHRGWIARRTCRGAYRKKGQKYDEGFIKPKAELRYNTGKKAACIMGAVGGGAQPGRQAGRQPASQPGRLTPGSLCSPRFVRVPCTKGGWAGGEGASPRRLGQRALSCRLWQHPATVAPTCMAYLASTEDGFVNDSTRFATDASFFPQRI